ncbi:hypothetical protein BcFMB_01630 [Bifidobacterium choerinum]|uniref:Uncharacterized protein n=1 Tax=Bifidobacterium choerinum TaxID=35760 RepID=A0A2D3D319_9BIFI|nr:hypothetical protein BcFMB_01630 [Bifidobacterium choerinum]
MSVMINPRFDFGFLPPPSPFGGVIGGMAGGGTAAPVGAVASPIGTAGGTTDDVPTIGPATVSSYIDGSYAGSCAPYTGAGAGGRTEVSAAPGALGAGGTAAAGGGVVMPATRVASAIGCSCCRRAPQFQQNPSPSSTC